MTSRARRLLCALAAPVAAVLVLAVGGGAAQALPPDGPSPDTPGTWASVSPARVAPGEVLSFSVGGFPAGETVYIKVDDGSPDVCSASAAHGACVIHTQVIPSSGVVSGSLVVPGDLPAGNHWLRFLASAYADPADPTKGTLGFTTRGASDFTVVAPGAGSPAGSAPGAAAARSGATGTVTRGGVTSTVSGGVAAAAKVEPVAEPTDVPEPPAASGSRLTAASAGGVRTIAGEGRMAIQLADDYAAEWVFVYAFSQPTPLGWQQVAVDGTVQVPTTELHAGPHRFAALDAEGALIGWAEGEVAADAATSPSAAPVSSASAPEQAPLPALGLGVLGACLLLGAGVIVWAAVSPRRRRRATHQAASSGPIPQPSAQLTTQLTTEHISQ